MSTAQLDSLGISAYCESMAMLLKAGIQYDEAITLLQDSGDAKGILNSGLKKMEEKTQEGSTLAEAMDYCGIFPSYAVNMVKLGEDSGRLEDTLFQLSRYYKRQKNTQNAVKNAVLYPAAMLLLVMAVLIVMLVIVLPTFSDVYAGMSVSLSASSYDYIGWSYFICRAALVVLAVLAALLFAGILLWKLHKTAQLERYLQLLPTAGAVLEAFGLYRFSLSMANYLSTGESQDTALQNSIPLVECASVEKKLQSCAKDMEEGVGIAQSAYTEKLFEPVYGRLLLAGDRGGALEDSFMRIAELLEEHCSDLLEGVISLVDPVISGILMVTIGFSLLSIMLPLIGIMNSIR